eukprot:CAMPEP_0185854272 /NCGR_PEP_ID=MMETSP1354-20130828/21861_1 /TAXON_ID=708628 /ORGANISM="Erythrolobus madagascarensis, Strain CCMP3276" /LENGTH=121 /DNA_ID=CAMNT_0028555995 /DNA_START=360 /DNA_END=725 /DNA_ORIENTATION=-
MTAAASSMELDENDIWSSTEQRARAEEYAAARRELRRAHGSGSSSGAAQWRIGGVREMQGRRVVIDSVNVVDAPALTTGTTEADVDALIQWYQHRMPRDDRAAAAPRTQPLDKVRVEPVHR